MPSPFRKHDRISSLNSGVFKRFTRPRVQNNESIAPIICMGASSGSAGKEPSTSKHHAGLRLNRSQAPRQNASANEAGPAGRRAMSLLQDDSIFLDFGAQGGDLNPQETRSGVLIAVDSVQGADDHPPFDAFDKTLNPSWMMLPEQVPNLLEASLRYLARESVARVRTPDRLEFRDVRGFYAAVRATPPFGGLPPDLMEIPISAHDLFTVHGILPLWRN